MSLLDTKKPARSSQRLHDLLDEAIHEKNEARFPSALRILSKTVAEFPECAAAHGLMGGLLLCELNKAEKAIAPFQEAVRLSPHSEKASHGLFHSLWESGRRREAKKEILRFQKISRSKDYEEIVEELKYKGLWESP